MAAVPAEVAAALVSWEHSGEYPLPNEWLSGGGAGFTKIFKLNDEEHAFIADHNVDGRILMPVRKFTCEHTHKLRLAAFQQKQ